MISKNFKRKEFACKCGCDYDSINPKLIPVLEDMREYFGKPVIVNSGCRCETHNRNVKGAPNSQHLYGNASDVRINGVPPVEIYRYFDRKYPNTFGIGLYNTFVHIDVREKRARW